MATRRSIARPFTAIVALLAALSFVPLEAAVAEPGNSPADARRELNVLNREVDEAVEDYDSARIELTRAGRRLASMRARIARAEAELRAAQEQMSAVAVAAYKSGGTDEFISLVTTASPQTFLDQATTLDRIARGQSEQLRAIKVARRRMKSEQAAAEQALEAQRSVGRRLAGVRRSIEAKVARQETLLAQLESAASRRARLARLASQQRASRSTRVAVAAPPAYSGPAEGRARIAVQAAVAQLGKPYRWGAAGPNSFDCSGLTMWAWGKAGVSLPHSSRMQFNEGRRVSRSELRPGDLVFFGSPIHHVGIYVGNNTYIAAPQTGDVVKYRSLARGDYTGAVRL